MAARPEPAALEHAGWLVADSGPLQGGPGVPLVFLHGLGTDAAAWDRVTPLLAGRHRVLAVDLPGYSLRSRVEVAPPAPDLADDLDGLLAARGITAAVLVGHSFGGAVALLGAQRHPHRCAGLVLIAPGGFGAELNPLVALVNTRLGPRLLRSLYSRRATRAIEGLVARVESRPGRAETRVRIEELKETYERLRSERARSQFRAGVRASLALHARPDRRAFAEIDPDIPVSVLWGRDDRVLPSWQAAAATELLPGSRVDVLDGVGHTPHRSHPDLVAAQIEQFVASDAVAHRAARLTRRGS